LHTPTLDSLSLASESDSLSAYSSDFILSTHYPPSKTDCHSSPTNHALPTLLSIVLSTYSFLPAAMLSSLTASCLSAILETDVWC
jgi:predicted phosphohydrolase